MAGRTVTGVTDCHRRDGPSQTLQRIESLNSVTEQQDGPSQARRPVTGCVIPDWVGFQLSNLRGVLDYSCFNYKVSGLMLMSNYLGVKRGNLELIDGLIHHLSYLII